MRDSNLQESDLQLAEAVPQPLLIVHGGDRRIIFANRKFAELSKHPQEWLAGRELDQVVEFDQPDALCNRGEDTGTAVQPASLRTKTGMNLPVQATLTRLQIGGEDCHVVAVDSEPGKAGTLNAGGVSPDENHFRELFENANDLIYTMDLEGRLTSANRATLRLFGYTQEEAIGMRVTHVVHPDFVPLANRQMEAKVARGEFTPPYELLCLTKSGEKIWVELSTRVVVREGKPVAVQGIARDITERKKAEALLKESAREVQEQKNLLDRMIEQDPHPIAFWNPDGTFHHCNEAFTRLVGFRPDSHYNLLLDPQIKALESYSDFKRAFAGEIVRIERVCYAPSIRTEGKPTGRLQWTRPTLFPIHNADGRVAQVVSYLEDLTAEVSAESDRKALEGKLLESEKLQAIGTLAGGVAHDFNNLLTGIMGYLDLLRTMSDERMRPILDKAEVVTQRASELTRQLLAYARKSRMEMQVHDLNTTAQEVSALLRQTVDRRIEIRTRILPEPATVKADPGQMNQVLLNLCLNARDAIIEKLDRLTGSDSKRWDPRISIEIRLHEFTQGVQAENAHAGLYVRMSVSDNGVGMDETVRQRIFEPFFTTKSIGKGTGLGLATAFGVIKQHRGWVEVDSTPGEGTLFQVFLPFLSESALPLNNAASSIRVKGGTETILLADDEEMIREIAEEILQNHGYRVILACDGWEALEIFQQRKDEIALVILDLTMPRMSGREIIPKLIAVRPESKIIAMSGYSFSESWPDFHNIGAAAFIQKPYNAVDLLQTVRRVLDAPSPSHLRRSP